MSCGEGRATVLWNWHVGLRALLLDLMAGSYPSSETWGVSRSAPSLACWMEWRVRVEVVGGGASERAAWGSTWTVVV